MKPTAYLTQDRRMLIFADSPNMMPSDKSGLIPLYELPATKPSSMGCGGAVSLTERCGLRYLCHECGEKRRLEEAAMRTNNTGFNEGDSVAYQRFEGPDNIIYGEITSLCAVGAWIATKDTGEHFFASYRKLSKFD